MAERDLPTWAERARACCGVGATVWMLWVVVHAITSAPRWVSVVGGGGVIVFVVSGAAWLVGEFRAGLRTPR